MNTIEIEGKHYIVMTQDELDAMREECFRQGRMKEWNKPTRK